MIYKSRYFITTYCKITMLWFQSSWLIFLGNCLTFTITLIKICMCFFLHIRSYSKCGNIYVGINYMSEWIGSTINVCNELKSEKNVQFWKLQCLCQGMDLNCCSFVLRINILPFDANSSSSPKLHIIFRFYPIAYIHIDGVKKAIMKNQGQHLTSNYTHMNFLLPKFSSWTIQSKVKTIFERDKIPLLIAECVVHT